MRTSERKINKILDKQIRLMLSQVICDIKTPKEADAFLKDFLTSSEYETLSKRLAVAYWLKKGRSYANIKTNIKVSSATIATVSENLKSHGVELALKKIEDEEWASQWAQRIKKFVPTA